MSAPNRSPWLCSERLLFAWTRFCSWRQRWTRAACWPSTTAFLASGPIPSRSRRFCLEIESRRSLLTGITGLRSRQVKKIHSDTSTRLISRLVGVFCWCWEKEYFAKAREVISLKWLMTLQRTAKRGGVINLWLAKARGQYLAILHRQVFGSGSFFYETKSLFNCSRVWKHWGREKIMIGWELLVVCFFSFHNWQGDHSGCIFSEIQKSWVVKSDENKHFFQLKPQQTLRVTWQQD